MQIVTPQLMRKLFSTIARNPSWGSYKLAEFVGLGHTTVDKYRAMARKQRLSALDVEVMTDDDISKSFGLNKKQVRFIFPDWEEIKSYLLTPRKWGSNMNSEQNAYRIYYVKKYWPNLLDGEPLPPECMSERSFNRYYADYLKSQGLDFIKHTPNANAQFGPASMMEIDTIGDKLSYFDTATSHLKTAVIFTAVSKFSGLIYAEAMPSAEGHCWSHAIINACWFFGGLHEVIRADNDSAITLHGQKFGRSHYSCLRPAVRFLFKELDLTVDLCPRNSPQWKGSVENSNKIIEKQLFSDHERYPQPLRVNGISELNDLILQEVGRINLKPRAHSKLSRRAIFDEYERPRLKQLPLFKPEVRYLSMGRVCKDGYVCYAKNYYYAGGDNIGTNVVIENMHGHRLRILNERTLKEIVNYELDRNLLPPAHHHKDPKFQSETEQIINRTKEWFIDQFSHLTGPHDQILRLIDRIWVNLAQSKPIAVRRCNMIWQIYQQHPQYLEVLNEACGFILHNKDYSDFRDILKQTFLVLLDVKSKQPVTNNPNSQEQSASNTNSEIRQKSCLHGSAYYENLNR